MKTILRIALLCALVAQASSCAYSTIKTKESDADEKAEVLNEQITVGETTREGAQELLGSPLAVSSNRAVEVYRAAKGRDTEVGLLFPFPVTFVGPVVGPGAAVRCFTMLGFDRDGLVESHDHGCVRNPDSLQLSTGNVDFRAQWSSASAMGRLIYEEALIEPLPDAGVSVPEGSCQVLFVAWRDQTFERTFRIKDQIKLVYGALSHEGPIQLLISAGTHEAKVAFQSVTWTNRDKLVREFTCADGDTVVIYDTLHYVLEDIEGERKWWQSDQRLVLEGAVEIGDALDKSRFDGRFISYYATR